MSPNTNGIKSIERIGPDPALLREYVDRQIPVVIRGLMDGEAIRTLDTLDALVDRCGAAEVAARPNYDWPVFENFDQSPLFGVTMMRLSEYVEHAASPGANLSVVEQETPEELLATMSAIPAILPSTADDPAHTEFFMANQGNCTHLHFDGDLRPVLLYQVTGVKRFVLFPVDATHKLAPVGNFSAHHLQRYTEADKLDFMRYVGAYDTLLEPGETIYMPPLIWHYIEYTEGIGVSVNFRYSRPPLARRFERRLWACANFQAIGAALVGPQPVTERTAELVERVLRAQERLRGTAEQRFSAIQSVVDEVAAELNPGTSPYRYMLRHGDVDRRIAARENVLLRYLERDLEPAALRPDDVLTFVSSAPTRLEHGESSGVPTVTVHYGKHEIEFDEPELWPFARELCEQRRFTARSTQHWAEPSTTHEWPRIAAILQQLIDSEILEVDRSATAS